MADEDLISRIKEGDKSAFGELVRRHQAPIYYYCLRMSGREEDARDLTQRTFIRAYKAVGRFEGRSSLNTWLFQIAANLCRNHHRDRSRVQFVPEENAPEVSQEAVAEEALSQAGERSSLRLAVAQLPSRQREVLSLRVYQDLPFKEIAQKVGISVGNARVSYHVAVKALREIMGEQREGA